VQASVHRFDPQTGGGSVLLDNGTELPFAPDAFERSGLRLLRVGQRLTVDVDEDAVTDLRLLGI
jgi:2-phospho-L-lactate/phosphoenolpyruvate guanylyltransferase